MVTAKQIITFHEEFFSTYNILNREVDILLNPSVSEINQCWIKASRKYNYLHPEIRFIFDIKHRQVYVWIAGLAIHNNVLDKLKFTSNWLSLDYVTGVARYNGKIQKPVAFVIGEVPIVLFNLKSTNGSEKFFTPIQNFLKQDFSWADRYVACNQVISELKSDCLSVIKEINKK